MNQAQKKSIPKKTFAITLSLVLIVFVACIAVENNEISLLKSQIFQIDSGVNSTFGLLFSNFSNQSMNLTGATFVTINQINLDPVKWDNQKVAVAGRLSGPYPYPFAISYYYILSLDETVPSLDALDGNSIGVDFSNRGILYNASVPALIVGVVHKGIIGTNQVKTTYYIEEQDAQTS
jgi:hypothetical protein